MLAADPPESWSLPAVPTMVQVTPGTTVEFGFTVVLAEERSLLELGAAKWKLGLRPEDGGVLKVQLEVEEAKPGQQWSVRIADNGSRIFSGSRTANQFGKFTVRTSTTNRAGSDHVTGRATNTVTGQVCNASATL